MRIKDPNGDEQDQNAPAGEEDPYGQQSLASAPAAPKAAPRDYSSWLGGASGTGTAVQAGVTPTPVAPMTATPTKTAVQGGTMVGKPTDVVTEGYGATQGQYVTPGGSNTSGQFVNFDRYLDANRDAATAAGGKLASGVASSAQAAQDAANKAYGSVSGAIQAGIPKGYDGAQIDSLNHSSTSPDGKVGTVRQGMEGGGRLGPDGKIVAPAPGTPYTTPLADIQKRLTDARYTGPTNHAGLDAAGKAIVKSQSDVNAFGKKGGLEGLLQRDNADETSGGSAMDAALYGSTSGKTFADLQKKYANLDKAYRGQLADVDAQIGDARRITTGTQQRYQGMIDAEGARQDAVSQAGAAAKMKQAETDAATLEDMKKAQGAWLQTKGRENMSSPGRNIGSFRSRWNTAHGRAPNDDGPDGDLLTQAEQSLDKKD